MKGPLIMNDLDCKEQRKQIIRDTKANLILDAALEVLCQKGYYETRLEDIAEKAGFSKSALYRYYKDKDEIFFTIVVRERNKVIEKLLSDPEYCLCNNNHINENLRRFLTVIFTVWGQNFAFILTLNSFQVFTLINQLQNQSKLLKIEEDFLISENKLAEITKDMFDNARKEGEITTPLSTEFIIDFFQAIIFTKIKKWYQEKCMENITKAINEILVFLSNGLGIIGD